jgi:hypothetical protein
MALSPKHIAISISHGSPHDGEEDGDKEHSEESILAMEGLGKAILAHDWASALTWRDRLAKCDPEEEDEEAEEDDEGDGEKPSGKGY